MSTVTKIIWVVLGVAALAATTVGLACTVGVAKIGEQEYQEAQRIAEDDRLTCGLIEED